MQNKFFLFVSFILIHSSVFCQIENLKWQKAELTYEKSSDLRERNYSFQADNAGEFIKKSLVNAYRFFISDVDGDNCPFRPSCSSFFMDATEETNIFQGSLMFTDRLTRDLNPVKSNKYPKEKNDHYYDPAMNYSLSPEKIKYFPPDIVIDDE